MERLGSRVVVMFLRGGGKIDEEFGSVSFRLSRDGLVDG